MNLKTHFDEMIKMDSAIKECLYMVRTYSKSLSRKINLSILYGQHLKWTGFPFPTIKPWLNESSDMNLLFDVKPSNYGLPLIQNKTYAASTLLGKHYG